jgi:hypothetical protein
VAISSAVASARSTTLDEAFWLQRNRAQLAAAQRRWTSISRFAPSATAFVDCTRARHGSCCRRCRECGAHLPRHRTWTECR